MKIDTPTNPVELQLPSDAEEPTYLRQLHPMPEFDDHIRMDRVKHVYYLDGEPLTISTTGFMKSYVGEFKQLETAEKIAKRVREYEQALRAGLTRTLPAWRADDYARYGHCQSAADIIRAWNDNRDEGTQAHRLIELYYNNMLTGELASHPLLELPEFKQFLVWDADVRAAGYEPFRTEFTMHLYEIGGQIDMLYRKVADRDDPVRKYNLYMVDWKRKFELGPHGDPLEPPFSFLPPGDRTKFTIQLNTYKRMIEQLSPYRIERMSVVLIHPEMAEYYTEEIRDIQDAIAAMFEGRRLTLIERRCSTAAELLRVQCRSRDANIRVPALARASALLQQALKLDPLPAVEEQLAV